MSLSFTDSSKQLWAVWLLFAQSYCIMNVNLALYMYW